MDEDAALRAEPVIIHSLGPQYTIGELLHVLRELVAEYPQIVTLPVFHVEYGGLVPTRKVEIPRQGDMMVLDQ